MIYSRKRRDVKNPRDTRVLKGQLSAEGSPFCLLARTRRWSVGDWSWCVFKDLRQSSGLKLVVLTLSFDCQQRRNSKYNLMCSRSLWQVMKSRLSIKVPTRDWTMELPSYQYAVKPWDLCLLKQYKNTVNKPRTRIAIFLEGASHHITNSMMILWFCFSKTIIDPFSETGRGMLTSHVLDVPPSPPLTWNPGLGWFLHTFEGSICNNIDDEKRQGIGLSNKTLETLSGLSLDAGTSSAPSLKEEQNPKRQVFQVLWRCIRTHLRSPGHMHLSNISTILTMKITLPEMDLESPADFGESIPGFWSLLKCFSRRSHCSLNPFSRSLENMIFSKTSLHTLQISLKCACDNPSNKL